MALNRLQRSALAPWAGLVTAAIGMAVQQQLLGDMLRFECRLGTPTNGVVVGVLVMLFIGVGCWVSWASARGATEDERHQATRRFIVHLSLLFALLLSVAVVWQVVATFLVPACPD